ncbi:response regulator [Massilia sp. CT11-108]|uniref:response regulator n=1 Tax=Massilia sp. CT11-108 TaxID=3393900 RepID=UPI0039A49DC2
MGAVAGGLFEQGGNDVAQFPRQVTQSAEAFGEALACARERSFDAFVLDIGLPGMDGHELARQIRALPRAAGALFIALTGYGQQQDRDASKAAGFHYHFVKPADVDALAQALAKGTPA